MRLERSFKVSIVFHVAATIKFNEPLDVAMNVNVAGTGRVLNLAQKMKNIKVISNYCVEICCAIHTACCLALTLTIFHNHYQNIRNYIRGIEILILF